MVGAVAVFAIGVLTLSNSQDGEAVGVETRPVTTLPVTPNALLVVEDGDGALVSLTVMTLLPDGTGGTIVGVPVNADATAAFGGQRRPLDELYAAAELEASPRWCRRCCRSRSSDRTLSRSTNSRSLFPEQTARSSRPSSPRRPRRRRRRRPIRTRPSRTRPSRIRSTRAGLDRAGYDGAGLDGAGFDRAGFDRSGLDRAGFDRSGLDRSGHQ